MHSTKHIAVANYIVNEILKKNKERKFQDRISMTVNKLQKILYFCDIEYMKRHNGKLLFSENFKAWPSGPAIPDIYTRFIQVKDSEVQLGIHMTLPEPDQINEEMKITIDDILEITQDLDTKDLIEISKITGGPWYKAYRDDDFKHSQIISKEEMYNFYLNKSLPEILETKFNFKENIENRNEKTDDVKKLSKKK